VDRLLGRSERDIVKALEESEAEYRTLVENAPAVIVTFDLKGKVTSINRAVEEFGFRKEEIVGKYLLKFIPKSYWQRILKDLTNVSRGEIVRGEVELNTPKGKKIAEYRSSPIRIGEKVIGIQAILRDITERKKAEERIRASEERYRGLVELAPDSIMTFDLKGVITSCNTASAKISGYSRDELVGKHFAKIGVLRSRDILKYLKMLAFTVRGKVPEPFEVVYRRKDGTFAVGEVRVSLMREGGRTVGIQAIMRDITERKRMEEALARERDLLRTLMDSLPDFIFVKDTDCRLIMVNRASAERTSGTKPEDLIGKTDFDTHPKELAEQYYADDQAVIRTGQPIIAKEEPSFEGTWLSTTKVPLKDKNGRVVGIIGIARDITEKKRFEEALAHERDLLYALMDNIPDAIYFKDNESRFTRINKAQAQILGVRDPEDVIDKTDFDFFTSEHAKDAFEDEQRILKSGQPLINKIEKSERPDGYFVWHTTTKVPIKNKNGQIIGTVGISRDITERMQMEEELKKYTENLEELVEERTRKLREAERMATIGKVASMVGHDLRNPLTGIAGAAYFLKKKLGQAMDEKLKEMLDLIDKNVEYSNNIINDLSEYSSDIRLKQNETSPESIIGEALSLVEIPRNIQVLDKSQDKPKMNVDVTRMKRVFVNLIKNAVEAMPKGGTLTIESRKKDGNVELRFIDTGVGIPEDVLEKLFTPFFTTKPKGIGLGLSICKRIVEAHEGKISVESTVGKGTTFTVMLPTRPKNEEREKV